MYGEDVKYAAEELKKLVGSKITDTVMYAIGDLTGEEYDPEKGYMNPKVMPKEMKQRRKNDEIVETNSE